jgi:ABC-type Fe3+ transport system permease subunit
MMLPIQIQILSVWMTARDRVLDTARHARSDDRGELTGNVIFLAALAVAAAAVAAIIIARLNSNANKVPG